MFNVYVKCWPPPPTSSRPILRDHTEILFIANVENIVGVDAFHKTMSVPLDAASLPDLNQQPTFFECLNMSHSNHVPFLYPEQTKPTLTLTCRVHRRTVKMNWWVSIRKQSAALRASGEEARQQLMSNTQDVSAGRAGRSTALWPPTMTATAVKLQLTLVRSVSGEWSECRKLVCF